MKHDLLAVNILKRANKDPKRGVRLRSRFYEKMDFAEMDIIMARQTQKTISAMSYMWHEAINDPAVLYIIVCPNPAAVAECQKLIASIMPSNLKFYEWSNDIALKLKGLRFARVHFDDCKVPYKLEKENHLVVSSTAC